MGENGCASAGNHHLRCAPHGERPFSKTRKGRRRYFSDPCHSSLGRESPSRLRPLPPSVFPDQEARATHYAIEIPWAMGLIGTRSLTQAIPGINELVAESEVTIRDALMTIREERDATPQAVRHV